MWAVWALIGIFFFTAPWPARGGSCMTAGAFHVSWMVLELPGPFIQLDRKPYIWGTRVFFVFPF